MKTATRHTRVGWAWWAAGALAAMLPAALWSASPASAPAPGADTFEPPRYRPEGPRRADLLGPDAEDVKALGKARQLAIQGNTDAAFEIFQALLEKAEPTFLSVGEGGYLPMDYVVAGEMTALGEQALEAYRARYAATAATLLERALRAGDEASLQRLAWLYVHTPAGASGQERLGSLAFDRGDFPQAALCWERLLRLRAAGCERAMLLARAAVAWRLAGRDDRAKALAGILRRQFPAAAAVVGESRRNLADFVDATLAAPRPPVRLAVGEGWSGLGGVSGPTPPDAKAGIVLATRWVNPPLPEKGKALELVAQFAARPEREGYRISPVLRKGQVLLAKTALPAAVYPVVAGEGAIYRSDSHVTACDLLTGQALWSLRLPLYREPKEVADTGWVFMQNSQGEETALADPGGHLMTLADGVLFVRYGIPNSASGSDTASGLAAVATGPAPAGGTLIWEVGFRAGEGFLHDLQFTSAPTVAHGRVFVVGYQALKCYLVCLEAATGKLLWRRWICDAPREGGQANMPWGRFRAQQAHSYQRSSPPAVAGSTVLVLPNNGLLVALDAAAGGLLWARRYDGPPEPNNDYGVGESDWGATRGSGGPINPVLVLGDRVICLPADRASLLALDIHDGRAIWGKGDPNRFTLRFLCALDPERILLAGPGLEVRSAATGEVCHKPLDIQDVTGRPARMGRFVLASGVGRLHRLDLGDYSHAALPLEDPRGLLGNLAVSGQTLLAANAAGLCAYFEYDDACRRLDDRIAKSPRADVGPLLLQRALLAFHAKAFDRVAADLDAARAAAREQFDAALLEQAGLWTHRLAVARGNHAPTTAEAIDWFQKARQTASTDEDKAAAMLRLAKAYETAAPPAAAALAQELAEAFPVTLIPDVAIGVNAPAWSAPESDEPFAPASDRAQALIAALIARHGRDCYAGFDREAAAALEKARTDQNPQAALDVAQRWPQSLAVPAARYAAAELFCLQALKNSDHREENLCEAFAQLSQLAASDDPTLSLQARLAVRVIRLRLAGPTAPPSLPDTLPAAVPDGAFSFLDVKSSLRDVVQSLRAGKLPGK